ncbi:hypothetical protein K227x_50230 [Rubripirellula lacrimiformis]|uniref:Uncharacterized protein n=1 Tax=Rubripirellula lacrimiformis TaxID=1930273 RepID=A0A517NHL1_9BACT|nr:hypothetical protein [Rubripirellula lacrimiformis]QDT06612.1 hypothetical protein K227x_50230 [Rubripirellula lacrimiformis]
MAFLNSVIQHTALLAETHLTELADQYQDAVIEPGTSWWWYAWIPATIILLGGLAMRFADQAPAITNTPLGMLRELCSTHRIKGKSRVLLEEIAVAAAIENPATILLNSRRFDEATAIAARRITLDTRQKALLGIIRRRVFVDDAAS